MNYQAPQAKEKMNRGMEKMFLGEKDADPLYAV